MTRGAKACTEVLDHRGYPQQLDNRPALGVAESGHRGTAYGGSAPGSTAHGAQPRAGARDVVRRDLVPTARPFTIER